MKLTDDQRAELADVLEAGCVAADNFSAAHCVNLIAPLIEGWLTTEWLKGAEAVSSGVRERKARWYIDREIQRREAQAPRPAGTHRKAPVAANTPEPDPVGTPEPAEPSEAKSFIAPRTPRWMTDREVLDD